MGSTIYNVELDWVKIEKISTRLVLMGLVIQCEGLDAVLGAF